MRGIRTARIIIGIVAASLVAAGCSVGAGIGISIDAERSAFGGAMATRIGAAEALVIDAATRLGMVGSETPGVIVRIRAVAVATGGASSTATVTLGRAYIVPLAEPGSFRWNASLDYCLGGKVRLAAFDEVPSGLVALRVDGLAVDDAAYPLAVDVIASIEAVGGRRQERAAKAMAASLAASAEASAAADAKPPDIYWIAAAGDMMLGRGSAELWASSGADGLLGGAAAYLEEADAAVVNLEGAITARGRKAAKAYAFRFPRFAADLLSEAGVDAVLLSNNHALDYGLEGLVDTLDALAAAGVGALGAGRDIDGALAPRVADGARLYGLSSYPAERSGWDGADHAASAKRPGIARAERGGAERLAAGFAGGSIDAVFVHGGQEWSSAPDSATKDLFRGLVDLGADAVFGSHPHVAQGWELYEGRVIFWSLGNFVFPGMEGTRGGERGLLAQVGFADERPLYVRAVPLRLEGKIVDLAD